LTLFNSVRWSRHKFNFGDCILSFPNRIYTEKELERARSLIQEGYKHELRVAGSPEFIQKVNEALNLIKLAGYYDFLRTYIREIREIDGLTQLRETEASIWANKFAVENPVDAASLIVQKTYVMKEYIDGKLYYGGLAEKRSVQKRIEFLKQLQEKCNSSRISEECMRLLNMWKNGSMAY